MAAKYGSQVVFARLNHIAKSMRELNELWYEMTELCRYRKGTKGAMVTDKDSLDKYTCERFKDHEDVCHWGHCTVSETTEDNKPSEGD